MIEAFAGSWPALVTPFTAADEVNVPMVHQLIEHLMAKHTSGFYVCGATGQGVAMSVPERKLVAEAAVAAANGQVPVIVHVGCISPRDAMTLAEHAQAIGASGISSIIPPSYSHADSIYAYFAKLGEAAPKLPLLPYIYGGPIDAVALMRRLLPLSTIAGTKYTGPNMYELREVVTLGKGKWNVFAGMDEQAVYAVMAGADGNIGSTLNFMLGPYREIRRCVLAGDANSALQWQIKVNAITSAALAAGFPGALTAIMGRLGFDCGAPRLPHLALSEARAAALFEQIDSLGFAELAAM